MKNLEKGEKNDRIIYDLQCLGILVDYIFAIILLIFEKKGVIF
jgi:hypothetical protein